LKFIFNNEVFPKSICNNFDILFYNTLSSNEVSESNSNAQHVLINIFELG